MSERDCGHRSYFYLQFCFDFHLRKFAVDFAVGISDIHPVRFWEHNLPYPYHRLFSINIWRNLISVSPASVDGALEGWMRWVSHSKRLIIALPLFWTVPRHRRTE